MIFPKKQYTALSMWAVSNYILADKLESVDMIANNFSLSLQI